MREYAPGSARTRRAAARSPPGGSPPVPTPGGAAPAPPPGPPPGLPPARGAPPPPLAPSSRVLFSARAVFASPLGRLPASCSLFRLVLAPRGLLRAGAVLRPGVVFLRPGVLPSGCPPVCRFCRPIWLCGLLFIWLCVMLVLLVRWRRGSCALPVLAVSCGSSFFRSLVGSFGSVPAGASSGAPGFPVPLRRGLPAAFFPPRACVAVPRLAAPVFWSAPPAVRAARACRVSPCARLRGAAARWRGRGGLRRRAPLALRRLVLLGFPGFRFCRPVCGFSLALPRRPRVGALCRRRRLARFGALPPVSARAVFGGGPLVAPVVGFSGSRSAAPSVCAAVAGVVRALPPSAFVWAGCAAGADRAAVAAAPSVSRLRVVRVAGASVPAALVARSVAFVRALAAAPGAVLLSWPCCPCPAGLRPSASPSACFCGAGSGSWASAALAVGLGVSVVVFGACPPASWRPRAVRCFGVAGWLCRPVRVPVSLGLWG